MMKVRSRVSRATPDSGTDLADDAPSTPVPTARRRRLIRLPRFGRKPDAEAGVVATPVLRTYRRPALPPALKIVAYVALIGFCLFYGAAYALNAPRNLAVFAVPIALVVAAGIWALPSGAYSPAPALPWLFFGYTSAAFLWPNYLAVALPGLPWITLVRLTGIPLLVLMLVCVSVSPDFRRRMSEVLNTDPVIWRCVVAFAVIQLVSIAFSSSPGSSLSRYFATQLNWTSIFFAACYVFQKPGVLYRWASLLLVFGFIISCVGLWEIKLTHVPWSEHIPSFLKIEDEAVLKSLAGSVRAAVGVHRVQAMSGTPLGMAEFLGLTMPFAAHFLFGPYPKLQRLAAGVYIPLAIVAILGTDSRLGLVATLLSAFGYLLIWSIRRWQKVRASIIAPALVLAYPAIFCLGITATFVVGRLRKSIWGSGAEAASNESRQQQWATGIPKIFDHPLGHGVGQGAVKLGYFAADGTLTIDSYFLSLLLDYGVLGFLAYMAIFMRSVWTGGTTAMTDDGDRETSLLMPISVSLVSFLVVKSVFSQEDNHPLVFMMVAAVLVLNRRRLGGGQGEEATAAPRRRR